MKENCESHTSSKCIRDVDLMLISGCVKVVYAERLAKEVLLTIPHLIE